MINNIYLKLLIFSVSFFLIHFFLTPFMGEFYILEGIERIHLFLAISTFIFFVIMLKIKSSYPDNFGFTYLAFIFVKMVAAVIFLAPLLFGEKGITFKYVIHFFIVFFIYLFAEVYLLIGTLKK
jgi:hypothetical protein